MVNTVDFWKDLGACAYPEWSRRTPEPIRRGISFFVVRGAFCTNRRQGSRDLRFEASFERARGLETLSLRLDDDSLQKWL
jgi:hypothetical protein